MNDNHDELRSDQRDSQFPYCFFISLAPFSDYRVRRQLVFQAEYDVKCSLLVNPVSRSLLELLAKNHCNQIKEICQKGENSSK